MAPALAQLDQIQSTLAAMHDQAATAPVAEPAEPAMVAAVPAASSAADTVRAPASRPVEPEQGAAVDDRGGAQAAETPQDAAVRGSPWVLTEPGWMIQLIGFQSLDRAFEFAASYGLAGRAWTLTGSWRGQPWYSVLIEPHTDRAAAAAAFDALPSALRALDPLVRRLEAGTRLEPID
jgi:septal ring-binding cell division protein DamX